MSPQFWSSVSSETESETPTAHVNAGRPWTVRTATDEDVIFSPVERGTRDVAGEFGLSRQMALESLYDDQLQSADLFPDDTILRKATSTYCG
jgi:hypothetical protein